MTLVGYQFYLLHSSSSPLCGKLQRKFVQTSCSETTVHWPHFCRWQLRPMFIQSRTVGSENHHIVRPTWAPKDESFLQ